MQADISWWERGSEDVVRGLKESVGVVEVSGYGVKWKEREVLEVEMTDRSVLKVVQ